jgi:voltage-gated potassium channel
MEPPSLGRALRRAALLLGIITGVHVLAMMQFEGMSALEGFWLTLTTLFTVGYGDLSAKTVEGR